jgi:hypothetical protein
MKLQMPPGDSSALKSGLQINLLQHQLPAQRHHDGQDVTLFVQIQ